VGTLVSPAWAEETLAFPFIKEDFENPYEKGGKVVVISPPFLIPA
jgi:hypothetical protein